MKGLNNFRIAAALVTVLAATACSDSNNGGGSNDARPFAELYEQGITRYLGAYSPMISEQEGDVVNYFFGAGDGPLCFEGAEFSMATRNTGSTDLLIFLEGGGACWSEFCQAVPTANTGIPGAGINDQSKANNPVRGWNQVYVPYCDGSLHAGDRDVDTDGDGTADRFHRGLHNISAALDVAVSTFPDPQRIVLAGNSGGGFGTIFALPLVRFLYPDARIDIVNDSGVGVGRPDTPEFLDLLVSDWNLGAFIPESCGDCLPDDGHLTDLLVWQMAEDPDNKFAMLSYTQDSVLADAFLQIGGPAFEAALFEEMQQQEDANPQNMRSFLPAGSDHTFLQLDPDKVVAGIGLMEWLQLMLDDSSEWNSVRD